MDVLPYILPFIWLIFLESLTVRWVAGGPVPGLVSRIFATNLAGIALLFFISLTGWFYGWWPDIRNWALRDSFFLFLIIKAPIFGFLFRRWGIKRIFTLHVLSNFAGVIAMSLLFVYSPLALGVRPATASSLNDKAVSRLLEIRDALEEYYAMHGFYPAYIWGGDMKGWGTIPSPDPLLLEGYLHAYPVNPLNLRRTYFEPRRVPGWRELWFGYKDIEFQEVRNLWWRVIHADPRFGFLGTKMANILPDPNIPGTNLMIDVRFAIQNRWLPGGFFYRSYDLDENGRPDAYILGVCGDENAQATIDCYDAVRDRLTTQIGGTQVPAAHDGYRDGVIYRWRSGFSVERRSRPDTPPIPVYGMETIPDTEEPPDEQGDEGSEAEMQPSAGETEPGVESSVDNSG